MVWLGLARGGDEEVLGVIELGVGVLADGFELSVVAEADHAALVDLLLLVELLFAGLDAVVFEWDQLPNALSLNFCLVFLELLET